MFEILAHSEVVRAVDTSSSFALGLFVGLLIGAATTALLMRRRLATVAPRRRGSSPNAG